MFHVLILFIIYTIFRLFSFQFDALLVLIFLAFEFWVKMDHSSHLFDHVDGKLLLIFFEKNIYEQHRQMIFFLVCISTYVVVSYIYRLFSKTWWSNLFPILYYIFLPSIQFCKSISEKNYFVIEKPNILSTSQLQNDCLVESPDVDEYTRH